MYSHLFLNIRECPSSAFLISILKFALNLKIYVIQQTTLYFNIKQSHIFNLQTILPPSQFATPLQLYTFMADKKKSKKDQVKQAQLEQMMEAEKREEEKQKKQERLKQLAKKSAPLVNYGLLDAYQFFLSQLAGAGIPQGNVYEFAAQTLLKFEKNKLKKMQQLKEVERVNQEAVKIVSESPVRSKSKIQKQIKPQLLPFKGELNPQQLQFLERK